MTCTCFYLLAQPPRGRGGSFTCGHWTSEGGQITCGQKPKLGFSPAEINDYRQMHSRRSSQGIHKSNSKVITFIQRSKKIGNNCFDIWGEIHLTQVRSHGWSHYCLEDLSLSSLFCDLNTHMSIISLGMCICSVLHGQGIESSTPLPPPPCTVRSKQCSEKVGREPDIDGVSPMEQHCMQSAIQTSDIHQPTVERVLSSPLHMWEKVKLRELSELSRCYMMKMRSHPRQSDVKACVPSPARGSSTSAPGPYWASSLSWGLSRALQDVQQHSWPPPTRCQQLPPYPSVVIFQNVFRHCRMSPGRQNRPW